MAGLDRAVLVPVHVQKSEVPEVFGSIQFADLTSWDGDPTAHSFVMLVDAIRRQMMPSCRIHFESLLQPRLEDIRRLYEAYFEVAGRLGFAPIPGRFQPPSAPDEQRRFHLTVSSLDVSIEWDPTVANWLVTSADREQILDIVRRIERHVPLIWLRMLSYSGPFFSSVSGPRTHANFLGFASLMFFHRMFVASEILGTPIEVPRPLTVSQLSFPRWEGAISAFFGEPDDIAATYVTHLDDSPLQQEEVFYGPKRRSQLTYGRSLRDFPYAEPIRFERYVVPQRELRLALDGSTQDVVYGGNARVRKVVDLNGDDLSPLFHAQP
jgi:hypothetical protein